MPQGTSSIGVTGSPAATGRACQRSTSWATAELDQLYLSSGRYARVEAMHTPRRGLQAAFILGLTVLSACATGSTSSPSGTQPGALATFAKAFDDGTGHRRLVLLMSPT